ncbi:MAG: MATE family efflux transporter [Candidatus Izemoplasmatales bacterium]|nr:MATE family efflux transporter [Candidatus Izemoplasmatales bacterium]MDD4070317.1 MATE family efflux transporter [Candidatus Izemoplasmatales bacterium]
MKKIYNVTEGPILKKMLLLALPILLTTLSQIAYNLTDIFWIGRVDSIGMDQTNAVAAVGTVSYLTWFAFGFILIAKIGTSVKVSHAVGKKEIEKVNVFAANGLLLEAFLGIILAISILIFKDEFLSIFNIETPQIVEYALMYIPIIGGFIFIQFIVNGFVAINEGLGQTKINLLVLAIGFVFNMILDPLLILVFKLGITGAAIATVSSQAVTLIVFIFIYKKHNPSIKIFRLKNLNVNALKEIVGIGLPVGLQSMLFTVISIYIAREVFAFGPNVVAGQRVGVQIEQLTWMISSGFQSAITVFVGQNFGAKEFARIKRSVFDISLVLIPYALVISLMLVLIPEQLMRIFISEDSTVNAGITYLTILSISQVFMIIESIGAGFFNGIGKSYIPSIVGIVGNSIRIPFVIILTKTLFEKGIWWSLNISSVFKAVIIIIVFVYLITHLQDMRTNKLVVNKRKTQSA